MGEHAFVQRRRVNPPSEASPQEVLWLAGLLEGEGSFMAGPPSAPRLPILSVAMVDRDVIDHAGALLGAKTVRVRARSRRWQDSFTVSVRGAGAVAWMEALRPFLGARRQRQIERAVASYSSRSNRLLDDGAAWRALELLAAGGSVATVAGRLGVSRWCIYDLRLGRTHAQVFADFHSPRRNARPRGDSR
jgi:hypothetical protein